MTEQKPLKRTREEYLATSKSRLKPWEALGISRATYYRRETSPGETSPGETSSRETSSRETSPPVASPPIVGRPPLWATKTTGCNVAPSAVAPFVAPRAVAPSVARSALSSQLPNAIDLRLIRLVEGADIPAIGWTQKKTSTEAVDSILPHLPGPISELRGRSLERHYQKARDALPPEYGYWVFLVRRWGDREWDSNLDGPRDEVDAFIEIVGPRGGRDGIAELFDHLARQWAQGRQKLAWLRKYRERIKANPRYWPQLKPMRTTGSDAEAAAVVALICANLKTEWTVSLLAKRRRRGIYYMDHLTTEMRFREMLVMVDEGRGILSLPRRGLQIKRTVTKRIIENLIAAPDHEMGYLAMRDAIGQNIGHQVHTMRKLGILTPSPHAGCWTAPQNGGALIRLGAPLRLSEDALAKIARGQPIRNRRRTLWTPPGW
jgi:hypothetical protein